MTHPASRVPIPESGSETGSKGGAAAGTEAADVVAAAVLAVPGVAALHSGMFGEVGTYLPGRRVRGVRLSDTGSDIHVTLYFGASVRVVAEQIRQVVAALVPGPVHVTVQDVLPATAEPAQPEF